MDLGNRVRVRFRFTLNRRREEWIQRTWEAFTPGDVAQRSPPNQRSGGAEEEQLTGMDPSGAMSFLFCFSKVGEEERWWCRSRPPPSPSLDQGESRSTPTNGSPSFFCFCGPPTKKDARPRMREAREARAPAARKNSGSATVERWKAMRGQSRERERGAVKSRSGRVTTRWEGKRWVNLGVKEYSKKVVRFS
jgi:hypothetical protein